MLKLKNVSIDPEGMTMKTDYCWIANGREYDCDNATVSVTDAEAAGLLLKAKKSVKDKEGVK
jgi:hypothetical protein